MIGADTQGKFRGTKFFVGPSISEDDVRSIIFVDPGAQFFRDSVTNKFSSCPTVD